MIIDIVLLPPKPVSEKIGRFVWQLSKKFKLKMAVDNRKLLPHISLLHLKIDRKKLSNVLKATADISKKHVGMALRFTQVFSDEDYFVYDIFKLSALEKLHEAVVQRVSKFKTGFSGVGRRSPGKLEKLYIKNYGAGNILKYFQPHITLGYVRHQKDLLSIAKKLSKLKSARFVANRLAVTQVNHRNQVFKVIKEFKLT